MKVKLPEDVPPWKEEPNFLTWLQRNYGPVVMEDNMGFLARQMPCKPNEDMLAWLARLSGHPVWSQALLSWPSFEAKVTEVQSGSGGRLNAQIVNHHALRRHYDNLGYFMAARMRHAIRQGWLKQQENRSRENRYGIGYVLRNAVHSVLQSIGIRSRLTVMLTGFSYYHTNQVWPKALGRALSWAQEDVHDPMANAWTLFLSSQQANIVGMAVPVKNFSVERVPNNATYRPKHPFKWQNYQVVIHARFDSQGGVMLRGWTSPACLVLRGLSVVGDALQNGFPDGVSERLRRLAPCNRQIELRRMEVDNEDGVAERVAVEQYHMSFDQMFPLDTLWPRLEGFDRALLSNGDSEPNKS